MTVMVKVSGAPVQVGPPTVYSNNTLEILVLLGSCQRSWGVVVVKGNCIPILVVDTGLPAMVIPEEPLPYELVVPL